MSLTVKFKRLVPEAVLPSYQSAGAAGMDLVTTILVPYRLSVGERRLFPCGFAMALPVGYEAQVRPRSGLALKYGITVLNSPGTVDCDYRGEVGVILINNGERSFTVEPGMRIAQMVIAAAPQVPIEEVDELDETARGAGGFGSTGVAA